MRKTGFLMAAMMACMATMPRSAESPRRAFIKKVEKAKKLPASSAVPSAASTVPTKISCSIPKASPPFVLLFSLLPVRVGAPNAAGVGLGDLAGLRLWLRLGHGLRLGFGLRRGLHLGFRIGLWIGFGHDLDLPGAAHLAPPLFVLRPARVPDDAQGEIVALRAGDGDLVALPWLGDHQRVGHHVFLGHKLACEDQGGAVLAFIQVRIDRGRDEAAAEIGPALDGKFAAISLAQQALKELGVRVLLLDRLLRHFGFGECRACEEQAGDASGRQGPEDGTLHGAVPSDPFMLHPCPSLFTIAANFVPKPGLPCFTVFFPHLRARLSLRWRRPSLPWRWPCASRGRAPAPRPFRTAAEPSASMPWSGR